jgi:transcriptional regulator with XRE-family HTH domain
MQVWIKSGYNAGMMAGRPAKTAAPLFGQRLAALRRERGMTQAQLAMATQETSKMIEYYERRAENPSLDFVRRAALALGASVAELAGEKPPPQTTARRSPGPQSQLQRRFEQVKHLPRKQQEFVLQFLDTVLQNAEKAG